MSSESPQSKKEEPARSQEREPASDLDAADLDADKIRRVKRALEEEDEDLDDRRIAEVVARRFSFSGPLPPPETLRRYDEVLPGCAERIVAMAEKEQDHRHSYDHSLVSIFSRAQIFAFILGLVAILAGAYLLATDKEIGGFVLLLTAVGSIIGSLIYSRRKTEVKSESPESEEQRTLES